MTTDDDGYASPQERFVMRGIGRWAMLLKAIGLIDESEVADVLQRPFQNRGFQPVHAHWLKLGKPRLPGETGHDPEVWAAFVVEAHRLAGRELP